MSTATAFRPPPAGAPTGLVLSVLGCGYLGAVHAAAMAHLGHRVIGVETDPSRARSLTSGRAPFYEPGLDDLLRATLDSGLLTFTDDIAEAVEATIHFICVGTPQMPGRQSADLQFVHGAFSDLLEIIKPGDLVVGKSTVPVGTAPILHGLLKAREPAASLVWNPEFLREGFAVRDTLAPDRIVIGTAEPTGREVAGPLLEAYATIPEPAPRLVTDFATAELVKVAANAFLATKISFINAMADLCELAGADVAELADALGHDVRIGRRFLNAGVGFGGGCLPKDIRAFMHRAAELGAEDTLMFLREVDAVNLARREKVVTTVTAWLDGKLAGKRIAVLGAAFKPNSDDIRDSPALAVAESLLLLGADVRVTDPWALPAAQKISPALTYEADTFVACQDAEIVLLLTEWDQFVEIDPVKLGEVVTSRRVLDGRNALDAASWAAAGWEYLGIGRPNAVRPQ